MPITSAQLAKQAIQELIDLVAVDGMPSDDRERREILRLLAKSESWIPTHCPETGIDLDTVDVEAHAQRIFPPYVPASRLSAEAREREAALYRRVGKPVPFRSL
jgi:hypothetical protein